MDRIPSTFYKHPYSNTESFKEGLRMFNFTNLEKMVYENMEYTADYMMVNYFDGVFIRNGIGKYVYFDNCTKRTGKCMMIDIPSIRKELNKRFF